MVRRDAACYVLRRRGPIVRSRSLKGKQNEIDETLRACLLGAFVLLLMSGLGIAQATQSTTTSKTSTASTKSSTKAAAEADLVDINSATKDQLSALPGIGDAYSDKIIAGRPYKTKRDLVRRRSFPKPPTTKSKTMIIAKQEVGTDPGLAHGNSNRPHFEFR